MTKIAERPNTVHIYEEHKFVLIHTTAHHLWWPMYRDLKQSERWASPEDQSELQRLRADVDRMHELFKRAQDAITRKRKEQKSRARKEAERNGEDLDEWEDRYDDANYYEDEEDQTENLYLNMWCSIPLDDKLPHRAIQQLIASDLDAESTKLAARAYYKVEPTVYRLQRLKTDSCVELNLLLQVINRIHEGLWEIQVSNHKYKVVLNFSYHKGWGFTEVRAEIPIRLGDYVFHEIRSASDDLYRTRAGMPISISAQQALEEMQIKPTGERTEEDFALSERAKAMNNRIGTQIATKGDFIQRNSHWWSAGLIFRPHGSNEKPQKAIIEPKLGLSGDSEREREVKANDLPFVRCFSLERKSYGFFDVRDIDEYVFDRGLLDQLVMPQTKKKVLTSVISAKPGSVMADIVRGKHGGFVVLAAGPTGVGKTLTAEAVSEWLERPLYAVEVAELGTDVDKLESTLGEIFIRASRWNAILLFDEADVFVAKRDMDLERSAIVSVFLRLLDYHDGVIFMTTNRADILDPAMFSRLAMLLEYKPLNRSARLHVWNLMFREDQKLKPLAPLLSRLPLNGRQIRNTARVIRALNSQREDTIDEKEALSIVATATRARLTLWRRVTSRLGY